MHDGLGLVWSLVKSGNFTQSVICQNIDLLPYLLLLEYEGYEGYCYWRLLFVSCQFAFFTEVMEQARDIFQINFTRKQVRAAIGKLR